MLPYFAGVWRSRARQARCLISARYVKKGLDRGCPPRLFRRRENEQLKAAVRVEAPADLEILVAPSITVMGNGDATSFAIVVDKGAVPPGEVRHATLLLKHGGYGVRFPIAVAGTVPLPNLVVISVTSSSPVTWGAVR